MKTPHKDDDGKIRFDLLSPHAIEEMAEILTDGAAKYSDHNWLDGGGFKYTRVYAAAQRHLHAFMAGQDLDPETQRFHVGHAMCCLMFLLHYQITGTGQDDRRFKK
jgi:hypothetical protein